MSGPVGFEGELDIEVKSVVPAELVIVTRQPMRTSGGGWGVFSRMQSDFRRVAFLACTYDARPGLDVDKTFFLELPLTNFVHLYQNNFRVRFPGTGFCARVVFVYNEKDSEEL